MAKKKIKKAILAGLTAYAASKMLGKGKLTAEQAANMENIVPKKKPYAHELEKYISSKKPEHLGDTGKSMDDLLPWYKKLKFWKEGGHIPASAWKKHGGSIRTEHARMGKMIKAAQGTYARPAKMLKARYGTEVRTMGSNPHVPSGGTAYVKTKLNGTLKTRTF